MRKGSNPLPPKGARPKPPANPPSRQALLEEALDMLTRACEILEQCRDRHEDAMAEQYGEIPESG